VHVPERRGGDVDDPDDAEVHGEGEGHHARHGQQVDPHCRAPVDARSRSISLHSPQLVHVCIYCLHYTVGLRAHREHRGKDRS